MHIKNKIAATFLAIAIISILSVSMLAFFGAKSALLRISTKQLEALADLKADAIQTFFDDLKDRINIAQDYYNIRVNLPIVSRFSKDRTNPGYIKAKETMDVQLRQWFKVKKYIDDIMLVGPEGKVVYSANGRHMNPELDNVLFDPEGTAFEKGRKEIFIGKIFQIPNENHGYEFKLLVTAPVFDLENRFIGVIAFEINMGPVYKYTQDTTGLGKTGEVLVVRKKGDYALFLNPLRHDLNTALKRKVKFGNKTSIPAQEAANGRIGSGIAIDYRNKEALSAWRYIPALDWGIVAKIDLDEVLAPIIELRNRMAIFCFVIIILVVVASLVIAESISKPINRLHVGTDIIGQGNLDYRIDIKGNDEVSQLSRAFNQMTKNLKLVTTSRDELNREITERKEAEERLQASEARYRKLFEAAEDGILILDADSGKITDVNPFLKELMGYSHEELLGKKLWELGIFKDIANSEKAFLELQDKEYVRYEDLPLQHKDGHRLDVEVVSNIYVVNHVKVVQYNIRDIADRKKIEAALMEIIKVKSAFTSMVSHELRTPLSALKESVSQVLEGMLGTINEEQRKFLGIAKRNVDRLARLITEVLNFQTLETGKMVFKMQNNDINKVVEEIKETMNIIAKEKGLDFILNLDKELPKIKFDRDKISQVLSNLVDNSLKLTEKGSITISTTRGNNVIQVSVKDTGPGIKEEDIPRLFQQYEQLERKTGGTGLGLAISLEIIRAHGGKVWVESTFGRGTTMHFILPIEDRRRRA